MRTSSGFAEAEGTNPSKADLGNVFGSNTSLGVAAEAEGTNPSKAVALSVVPPLWSLDRGAHHYDPPL